MLSETGKFNNLLSPLKINNKYTMKNRVVSAPMAFALISLIPVVGEKSFRKLEAPARGGDAIVCVGELDVNFKDAVRIPLPPIDFENPDDYVIERVGEYAKRIHKHGAIALQELMHAGAEKTPLAEDQEAVGPNDEIHPNGTHVRAMTKDDMDRIANDFVICARFAQRCGFDGVLIHGGHGFLFSQYLSSTYNKRTDEYGGSLENRCRFPYQILKSIRDAMGEDFIIELRICGEDGFGNGGITPEETGLFLKTLEGIVDLAHITVGHYYEAVKTGQASSMYKPHGLNARLSEIIKSYTSIPIGVIGGINSPELADEILSKRQADYIVLGRQSIADPQLVNKATAGEENLVRRCIRCYKCFPGSPEEGYTDLPFKTMELAQYVGYCTINPLANLPFDPYELEETKEKKRVLIVGGGVAGMQAAITAYDRGHEVVLCEKTDGLGGLMYFANEDPGKADLLDFKHTLIAEIDRRDIDIRLNTEVDESLISAIAPEHIIIATGSIPISPQIPGIENAVQALEIYKGFAPGKKIVMVGGGLIGSEMGLFLAKSGHDVTIIEMLPRIANEAFGMYREALMLEIDKYNIEVIENTKCLNIGSDFARVLSPSGEENTIKADTVMYALGMKAVSAEDLVSIARERELPCIVIGDAVSPAKIDNAVTTGYMASIEIGQ